MSTAKLIERYETLKLMRGEFNPENGPASAMKADALDFALALCFGSSAVALANECDRTNGVRPASAPVTEDDEMQRIKDRGPAYPHTPNTAPPTPLASAPVATPSAQHFKPPFDNCSFRMCDLPGQCRGEGKCHHPASAPVAEDDEVKRIRDRGPAYPYTPNIAPPTPLASAPVADEREALTWYAEQAAGCRKLGPDGDAARQALDKDGGQRARAALASAPVDPEAAEADFLVRVFEELDTWRAEDWNELIERRPAILALLRPLVMASAPVDDERVQGALKKARDALELTLATAQQFEKQASKGTGGRRGGPVFEKARAAIASIDAALASTPVADAGNWQQYRLRGSDETAEQVIERERKAYADLLQSVMDKRRDQASALSVDDATRHRMRDAVANALGDAYDCIRVWEAWSCGTMSQDDFQLVAEDDDRLDEIIDAVVKELRK